MSPTYSSPPDPLGYSIQVWEIVRKIPKGKVATYGQIAKMIPPPPGVAMDRYRVFSPRWVGSAMAGCPDDIPWQRVINSQGKVSQRRSGGESQQRQILEEEGVVFDDRERVNLDLFGWENVPGPDLE